MRFPKYIKIEPTYSTTLRLVRVCKTLAFYYRDNGDWWLVVSKEKENLHTAFNRGPTSHLNHLTVTEIPFEKWAEENLEMKVSRRDLLYILDQVIQYGYLNPDFTENNTNA